MLVWMDLEMTGLDPTRHVIVEIATILTDDNLSVLATGPDLVVFASEEQLRAMPSIVAEMHGSSGLLAAVRASTTSTKDAEAATLGFLRDAGVPPGTVPLCGNSIGTDRRFLQEYMPALEQHLHYRNVDVSSVKELADRWRPDLRSARPDKATAHRALDDVHESIAELAFYRDTLFAPAPSPGTAP